MAASALGPDSHVLVQHGSSWRLGTVVETCGEITVMYGDGHFEPLLDRTVSVQTVQPLAQPPQAGDYVLVRGEGDGGADYFRPGIVLGSTGGAEWRVAIGEYERDLEWRAEPSSHGVSGSVAGRTVHLHTKGDAEVASLSASRLHVGLGWARVRVSRGPVVTLDPKVLFSKHDALAGRAGVRSLVYGSTVAGGQRSHVSPAELVREAGASFDKNHDGQLEVEELAALLARLGLDDVEVTPQYVRKRAGGVATLPVAELWGVLLEECRRRGNLQEEACAAMRKLLIPCMTSEEIPQFFRGIPSSQKSGFERVAMAMWMYATFTKNAATVEQAVAAATRLVQGREVAAALAFMKCAAQDAHPLGRQVASIIVAAMQRAWCNREAFLAQLREGLDAALEGVEDTQAAGALVAGQLLGAAERLARMGLPVAQAAMDFVRSGEALKLAEDAVNGGQVHLSSLMKLIRRVDGKEAAASVASLMARAELGQLAAAASDIVETVADDPAVVAAVEVIGEGGASLGRELVKVGMVGSATGSRACAQLGALLVQTVRDAPDQVPDELRSTLQDALGTLRPELAMQLFAELHAAAAAGAEAVQPIARAACEAVGRTPLALAAVSVPEVRGIGDGVLGAGKTAVVGTASTLLAAAAAATEEGEEVASDVMEALQQATVTGVNIAGDQLQSVVEFCRVQLVAAPDQMVTAAALVTGRASQFGCALGAEVRQAASAALQAAQEAGRELGPVLLVLGQQGSSVFMGASRTLLAAMEHARVQGVEIADGAYEEAREAALTGASVSKAAAASIGRALAEVYKTAPDKIVAATQAALMSAKFLGMVSLGGLADTGRDAYRAAAQLRESLPTLDELPVKKEILLIVLSILLIAPASPGLVLVGGLIALKELGQLDPMLKQVDSASAPAQEFAARASDTVSGGVSRAVEEARRAGVSLLGSPALASIASAAGVTLDAVGAGLAAGAEEAKEAVEAAGRAGHTLARAGAGAFEGINVGSAVEGAWEKVEGLASYALDRSQAQERLMAAAAFVVPGIGLCGGCLGSLLSSVDFLKVEIVRDCYQYLGVLMGNVASEGFSKAKDVWGNFSNLLTLNFSYISDSINFLTILIGVTVISLVILLMDLILICCCTSQFNTDTKREGHEAQNWRQKRQRSPRMIWMIQNGIKLLLHIYLPASQLAFQVLACSPVLATIGNDIGLSCTVDSGGVPDCSCSDWDHRNAANTLAVFILILISVAFPIQLVKLIQRNKPEGSLEDPTKRYDEDGVLVDYTDSMYHDDIMNTTDQQFCPYTFLYKGYERRWAYFKVVTMVIKLLFLIPTVVLYRSPVAQVLLSLLIGLGFSAFSIYSSPFISPHSDVMDISSRVSNSVTTLLAMISLEAIAPSTSGVMAALINTVQAINALVLILMVALSFKAVRNKLKACVGWMTLTDTCRDTEGAWNKIMPHINVYREAKHRVWHTFWNSLMLSLSPDEEARDKVAKRLLELQELTQQWGFKRVKNHWEGLRDSEILGMRQYVLSSLEGVDVYWDDAVTMDGKLDSKTYFGKLWVVAYPFQANMVYDDSSDVTFIENDKLEALVAKNNSDDIRQRRQLRMQLRAMSGQSVTFGPIKRMRTVKVPDGTRTVERNGRTETEQLYSDVTCEVTYSKGRFDVKANTDKEMSAGFACALHFSDGRGTAVAPRTGQVFNVGDSATASLQSAKYYTAGHGDLGIEPTFARTPLVEQLCQQNRGVIESNFQRVADVHQEYRNRLNQERNEKEQVLSSAFWMFVYNNFDLERSELTEYLKVSEVNPLVRALPSVHEKGLDFLFARVDKIRSSNAVMAWYAIWDMVWDSNKELAIFAAAEKDMDPKFASSVAYKPLDRDQLETWFAADPARALLRQKGKWVSDAFLNALYDAISVYASLDRAQRTTARTHADMTLVEARAVVAQCATGKAEAV